MMKDAWLDAVPYGGYQKKSLAWGPQKVGAYPSAYDETTTTAILLTGLVLITGGGAALGWFISGTKIGALYGALGGLSYSAANLAINASAMASELSSRQPQPVQQVPGGAPGAPMGPGTPVQSTQLPPGAQSGYPTQGGTL